jgi:hypothetical protein
VRKIVRESAGQSRERKCGAETKALNLDPPVRETVELVDFGNRSDGQVKVFETVHSHAMAEQFLPGSIEPVSAKLTSSFFHLLTPS